jgi:hypothetical protein
MTQHYTLNTVEVAAWCSKCGKETPHRVAHRRLQYCLSCYDKGPVKPGNHRETPEEPVQGNLFERSK